MKDLGHTVAFNYSKAPVEITFAQPEYFENRPHKYQIILCPWESTELPPTWKEKFHEADEVWATSQWVADVYRAAGVENVTRVYPHGIEKRYEPKLKRRRGPLQILNMGSPAVRKGSQEAFDAFREVFKDDPRRAKLTIKAYERSNVRWYDQLHRVRNPNDLPNVTVNTKKMELPQLVDFTAQFHANVYPSYGEGFGYIPLETLAQATPTLSTYDWAQYKDYISLRIEAEQAPSQWPYEHPGLIYKPRTESIYDQLLYLSENYDAIAEAHFKQALRLHQEYDWRILTQKAFDDIFNKFG